LPRFLIVGLGVVLGATVFRTDIAQATGLAQSVTVSNTASQAVPVREQNLDGGNIKVHEQGTASVNVTNDVRSANRPAAKEILFGGGQETIVDEVPAGEVFVLKDVRVWANPNISTDKLASGEGEYVLTNNGSGGTLTSFNLVPNSMSHDMYANDQAYLVLVPGDVLKIICGTDHAATFRYYASGDHVPTP
jgi:hypothetical protein